MMMNDNRKTLNEIEDDAMTNIEKELKDLSPPITFKMKTDKCVEIIREKEVIGHIFSELPSEGYGGTTGSFSGKRSIQLCGFDNVTGIWGCGCFKGKNDLCVEFNWKKEKCPDHTMVEIGKAETPYRKTFIVKKCWHCGKLEVE